MLMDKRKNLETQARALLDDAEAQHRSLTAEEDAQFERITDSMRSIKEQAERITRFDADRRDMEDTLRNAGHKDGAGFAGAGRFAEADQFRALYRGEGREFTVQATDEEARSLFSAETRALAKGTATAGGNTVPTSFYHQLVEHMINTAMLWKAGATVLNTASGENLQIPITTAHGSAALVAEAGTIPQGDPTFGQRTLGAYKYGDLILCPRELIDDTGVDLLGYLARQAGRAVGNALGADLVTGNGTSKPTGLFQSSTLGVTGATGVAGVPSFDNVIDLFYSVIPPYRNSPQAGWLVNDTTAGALRKLKDNQGRYLWDTSVAVGTPDMILGKPVWADANVAATGINAKSLAFGDLSQYYVRLVNGIRFERSDDFKFDSDVVAFRCLVRADGILVDQTGAVKHYVGAAS